MPIYEYVCQGCETRIEVKQKLSDPPLTTCERCGKALNKIISAPGIMFKGSGWYITDYSDKMKPPSGSDTAQTDGGGSKTDAKPDQKTPESKPASGTTPAAPAPATAGSSSAGSTGNSGSTPSKAPSGTSS
ncbi:hypothetical protein YTPLAS18_22600 [Nitrospira sp.]|nr:hypothetical protein YTPLAS18_22600 [Nitrospira sp.]